ncbi:MAG: hypothetical protein AMS27_00740 [Bacteroides sp. SM23_62_1]|nr:MAG: hypothetical protein AMS27_00740 [Bacteroides sp. SM23_62_1]
MRIIFVIGCFFLLPFSVQAQLGGSHTYAFLNLTNSARVASLGGRVNAIRDDDLNLPFHNPSLLNEDMHNHMVFNYVNYFIDINYGYAAYARNVRKIGNLAGGIHYINYGEFVSADMTGNKTGTFNASELALNLMWSRSYDSIFHFGVNLKPVYSSLERYNSFGIAIDAGMTYTSRDKLFAAAIVFRNIGLQLKTYHDQHRESLPFEVQLGLSQKLRYAPFRFSFVFHNLQKFDITYSKNNNGTGEIDPMTGEQVQKNKLEQFADQSMRHLIFGLEFLPFENFHIRAGYNYQRRNELKIESKVSLVGFSCGFGIKISKFHLSYGRASYHLAGASNHFSISSNLSSFYKRNQ